MTQNLTTWALPQLSKLLPIDEDSLKQIVTYTDTLSRSEAEQHLQDLLGDSPQALEFISSFQSRRPTPPSEARPPQSSAPRSATPDSRDISESEVPRPSGRGRGKKSKKPLHTLPARQIEQQGDVSGGYIKHNEDDYMASSSSSSNRKAAQKEAAFALNSEPDAVKLPVQTTSANASRSPSASPAPSQPQQRNQQLPPSAAGRLISEEKPKKTSRASSPAQVGNAKTKVNVSGGTSMRGASTTLNDLDSAIRSLEIQTNPSLTSSIEGDNKRRKCNCMAQRHALLEAAPNCLSCGKIICVKEGLGPCTFCNKPLLNSEDLYAMVRILKDERGKEKQELNNAAHKRPDISKAPRPFSNQTSSVNTPASGARTPVSDTEQRSEAEKQNSEFLLAKQHRDKLLSFQSQNARRTQIHDEASDIDFTASHNDLWSSPQERALQLRKQQRVLREMEFNSRPEYEKRRMVVSVDIEKGKAVRKMQDVARPGTPTDDDEDNDVMEEWRNDQFDIDENSPEGDRGNENGTGRFAKNPLLGDNLIRPVWPMAEGLKKGKEKVREKTSWRRVQDDMDDNEQWILDGGMYGEMIDGRVLGSEEPAHG